MGQHSKVQSDTSAWQHELASLCRATTELSTFVLHLEERSLRLQALLNAAAAAGQLGAPKAEVAAEELVPPAPPAGYVDPETTGYAQTPAEVAQRVKRRPEDPNATWYTSFVSLEPGVYANSSECTRLTLKVVGGLNVKKDNQAEALAAYHNAYYNNGVRRMAMIGSELPGRPRAK